MANVPPEEGQAAAELSEDAGTEEGYAPALEYKYQSQPNLIQGKLA